MNWQHSTMYLFFGLAGIVSLVVHTTDVAPLALDRLMLAVAFFNEGKKNMLCQIYSRVHSIWWRMCLPLSAHTYSILAGFLFLYHLHGRTMLDVHVHQLLLYAIFGSAAVAFLEVFHRGNILMEMLRCTLTMLQGSWFWQVKPKNLQIKGFRARCENFLCICSLASDRFCAVSSSWS